MRPIDYEISEAQGDDGSLSLYEFAAADETSDPLMQLLAIEAEYAGELSIESYLSH